MEGWKDMCMEETGERGGVGWGLGGVMGKSVVGGWRIGCEEVTCYTSMSMRTEWWWCVQYQVPGNWGTDELAQELCNLNFAT